MKIKKILNLTILVLLVVVLGGCGSATKEVESSDESLVLLSWNDSGGVDYNNSSDWTKFSFSEFSLKMPKNFRVVNLASDQQYVELVNFAEVGRGLISDNELGWLKLKISLGGVNTNIEELVKDKVVIEELSVAGQTAVKVSDTRQAFVVYVKSNTQNKVYELGFSPDFEDFDGLSELVLSTIAFHIRGSL